MDLYSPVEINEQVIEILEKANASSVSLGGSRIGTKCFWYSTSTGLEIDYKFQSREFTRDNIWNEYCLQLFKTSNSYQYQDVDCYASSKHFICEHNTL
jgi:hypothetical protein